jgi:hypothetical protein
MSVGGMESERHGSAVGVVRDDGMCFFQVELGSSTSKLPGRRKPSSNTSHVQIASIEITDKLKLFNPRSTCYQGKSDMGT